jgi:hypothetical protein
LMVRWRGPDREIEGVKRSISGNGCRFDPVRIVLAAGRQKRRSGRIVPVIERSMRSIGAGEMKGSRAGMAASEFGWGWAMRRASIYEDDLEWAFVRVFEAVGGNPSTSGLTEYWCSGTCDSIGTSAGGVQGGHTGPPLQGQTAPLNSRVTGYRAVFDAIEPAVAPVARLAARGRSKQRPYFRGGWRRLDRGENGW